jgi:hypothetical protein
MEIHPVNNIARIVEHTSHDDQRQQPQKRHQPPKKEKVPSGPVYTPNGKLEEEPPSNIDVLV